MELAGVKNVNVDLSIDEFTVSYDPAQLGTHQMQEAIEKLGFRPSIVQSRVNLVGAKDRSGPIPEPVRAALAEAQTDGKLVFLDFYAEWCGACRKMDETFADAAVTDLLDENYVFLKVDTDQYPDVGKHFDVVGLPTVIAVAGSGEIVYRHAGPLDVEPLLDALTALGAETQSAVPQ